MKPILLIGKSESSFDERAVPDGFSVLRMETDSSEFRELIEGGCTSAFAGVVGADQSALFEAACLSSRFGIGGFSVASADCLSSRRALRARLRERGVAQPDYRFVSGECNALDMTRELAKPLHVVPVVGGGGRESSVADRDDLPLAIKRALKGLRSGDVVVESHSRGDVYSLVCVPQSGTYVVEVIIAQESAGAPFRFPVRLVCPATVQAGLEERLNALALEALVALEVEQVMVRVDVLVSGGTAVVLDVDALPPWTWFPVDLVALADGTGLTERALRIAAGECATFERPKGAASLAWISSGSGEVVSIEGEERAAGLEGVVEVRQNLRVGESVRHVVDPEGRDRIGYVAARGPDAESAVARVDAALASLCIETQSLS